MKKLLFIFVITLPFIFSCGNNAEVERLKLQNDSLRNVAQDKNLQVEEFMDAFAEIQENLNTIKEKEQIISLSTTNAEELTENVKQQINQDISTIYDLMTENKTTIKTLQKKLRASGGTNVKLEKTIALYAAQIEEKEAEISKLTKNLAQLNIDVENLNMEVTDLKSDIDTLENINKNNTETIENQDEEIHTAYYVYGTKDELKEHNIISKDGLLKKFELDNNFDKSYFTKIDIRKTKNIKLNTKKIEILTTHASNSYKTVKTNNIITDFNITNYEKFWEITKYLVILIK